MDMDAIIREEAEDFVARTPGARLVVVDGVVCTPFGAGIALEQIEYHVRDMLKWATKHAKLADGEIDF